MGVSQNVIISISLSLSLYFPDISSRQTKASKGMIPTTSVSCTCSKHTIHICLSLSFSLSLSCFCGFFRDPDCRLGALDVEPETGILVHKIFERELSKETSKQDE